MNLSLEKILNEYFMNRHDGGVNFNIKDRNSFLDFEDFLIKSNYNSFFKENTIKQLFENSVDINGTREYVKATWKKFMGTDISDEYLNTVNNQLVNFKTNYPSQTLGDAFKFLQQNPTLLSFQKKEVGEGEFAILLLVNGATKIPKGKKGDVQVGGISYEIKKIKTPKEAIRFGTNLNLNTITDFNKLILNLESLLKSKKYKEGKLIVEFNNIFFSILNYKDRGRSTDDLGEGSRASWTTKKIQKFYDFLKQLKEYTVEQKKEKSISSSTTTGKNFIFKVNDVDKDVYFKLPFDDIKKSASTSAGQKTPTQIEPTLDQQDTEEIVSFSEDVGVIVNSFLNQYPNVENFGEQVVKEINQIYNTPDLKLIIIDENNNFLSNPKFKFFSINQSVRPQVTLVN